MSPQIPRTQAPGPLPDCSVEWANRCRPLAVETVQGDSHRDEDGAMVNRGFVPQTGMQYGIRRLRGGSAPVFSRAARLAAGRVVDRLSLGRTHTKNSIVLSQVLEGRGGPAAAEDWQAQKNSFLEHVGQLWLSKSEVVRAILEHEIKRLRQGSAPPRVQPSSRHEPLIPRLDVDPINALSAAWAMSQSTRAADLLHEDGDCTWLVEAWQQSLLTIEPALGQKRALELADGVLHDLLARHILSQQVVRIVHGIEEPSATAITADDFAELMILHASQGTNWREYLEALPGSAAVNASVLAALIRLNVLDFLEDVRYQVVHRRGRTFLIVFATGVVAAAAFAVPAVLSALVGRLVLSKAAAALLMKKAGVIAVQELGKGITIGGIAAGGTALVGSAMHEKDANEGLHTDVVEADEDPAVKARVDLNYRDKIVYAGTPGKRPKKEKKPHDTVRKVKAYATLSELGLRRYLKKN